MKRKSGNSRIFKHFITHYGARGAFMTVQSTAVGSFKIGKIAKTINNEGRNYNQIVRLARKGEIPLGIGFFNQNKGTIGSREEFGQFRSGHSEFEQYLPLAVGDHYSYAPLGASFRDANRMYERRYDGYHVSEDLLFKLKVLFKLEEILPDENGQEVCVMDAVDRAISVRLGLAGGKPVIEGEYDWKERAIVVNADPKFCICAPFITENYWYELKNGVWVKSYASNPNANFVERANGVNWNGFFALEANSIHPSSISARHPPSCRLGLLVQAAGNAKEEAPKQ